jgi:hypothetical protein
VATKKEPSHKPEDIRLTITMDGPRVGEARLSVNDLAEIIRRGQQALRRVAQVLYGQSSIGKGRKKKDIEDLCELYFVAWERGSAQGVVQLATPPPQLALFGSLGEESLQAFLRGMERLSQDDGASPGALEGFDAGVLETLDAMGAVLDHGVDFIRFSPEGPLQGKTAVFDRPARERVRKALTQPQAVGQVTKAGRLEMVSGHGGLKGNLWEANGTKWTCLFDEDHLERLAEAWMRSVQVSGKTLEGGREHEMVVETILILDPAIGEEQAAFETPPGVPFWRTIPLEDLIHEQQIEAADDLDELSALWPGEEDPEALLHFVLDERHERGQLAPGGKADS